MLVQNAALSLKELIQVKFEPYHIRQLHFFHNRKTVHSRRSKVKHCNLQMAEKTRRSFRDFEACWSHLQYKLEEESKGADTQTITQTSKNMLYS